MPQSIDTLAEKIKKYGQAHLILSLHSVIIDGKKTLTACHSAGIAPHITRVTEPEARHLLFQSHPERALKLWPTQSPREAMQLFGAALKDVAPYFRRATKRYPPRPRHGRRTRKSLGGNRRYNLRLSVAHEQLLKKKSEEARLTPSDFLRAAIAIVDPVQVFNFFDFLPED